MKPSDTNRVFLTGSTGFLGHYVLAELLGRGFQCVTLLRPPVDASIGRLKKLLKALGVDVDSCLKNEMIQPMVGELPGHLPNLGKNSPTTVIHVAAATNFNIDASGNPRRTNVDGTRDLLRWAHDTGVQQLHLVSSAYTCGRTVDPVEEAFNANQTEFHNEYERSKWEGERLGVEWAKRSGGRTVIHRPSIIVGDSSTGRATKFGGVYLSMRATELLDRMYADKAPGQRQSIPLRIVGRPLDRQNIVPVDYVARIIVAAVLSPDDGPWVYNLVHPAPPSNLQIKQALESYFGIGGGRFIAPEEFAYEELSELERGFYDVIKPIEHYFVDTPLFCRTNTSNIEERTGIVCPQYDAPAITRLIRYALSTSWGRRGKRELKCGAGCAEYFESFLPLHVGRSQVARMAALTANVCFEIDDEPDGRWVCSFEGGQLTNVHRGSNGQAADFGYRTTRRVFWESISGRSHPQELFLGGNAEMFGDIERALKMSMVLHSFTQEYPCDPATLASFVEEECPQN